MMQPERRGAQILAPKRAEGSGGMVGDGWVLLNPGDPEYDMWDRYLGGDDGGPPVEPWQRAVNRQMEQ